jgi:hypothetical protein
MRRLIFAALSVHHEVMKFCLLLALLIVSTVYVGAKKRPAIPDQEPIERGCVVIDNIQNHGRGLIVAPFLRAQVHNNCDETADVMVMAAFLDSQGNQLQDGSAGQNVAPHTTWLLFMPAPDDFNVKSVRITDVSALLPIKGRQAQK